MYTKLCEELAYRRKTHIEETTLTVAQNLEVRLLAEAEKGNNVYYMALRQEDENLATSVDFIELLSLLLDGVKIEVVERMTFSMFKSKYLKFSW